MNYCFNYRFVLPSTFALLTAVFCFTSCNRQTQNETQASPGFNSINEALKVEFSDSAFAIGRTYLESGKKDSALVYFTKALSIREKLEVADTLLVDIYSAIGKWYFHDFKFEIADRYFEKARIAGLKINISPGLLVDIYLDAATCKREMQDLPTAKSMALQAIEILKPAGNAGTRKLLEAYSILSSIKYLNKQYEEALTDIDNQIQLALCTGNSRELGRLYSSRSTVYNAMHAFPQALKSINLSIAGDRKEFGPISNRLAIRYMNKGDIFQKLGQYDSARVYLRKNLDIRSRLHGIKHANTFGAFYTLGLFYYQQDEYDSAVNYFQRSIISLVKKFDSFDWQSNPTPDPVEANPDLILALVNKAFSLQKAFEKAPNHTDKLVKSLQTYQLADSIYSLYRRNTPFDDSQLAQMESLKLPYDSITAVSFRLSRILDKPEYMQHAFYSMERSRAVLLQDALQRAQDFNSAGILPELRKRYNRLMKSRATLLLAMSSNTGVPNNDSLNKEFLKLNDDVIEIEKEIATKHPGFYNIRFAEKRFTIGEAQRIAREKNAAIIQYQWSNRFLYSIVVTPDTILNNIIPITGELKEGVHFFTKSFLSLKSDRFSIAQFQSICKNGFLLYNKLIQDILPHSNDGIRNLIICPDGPLIFLPFEALITSIPKSQVVNYQLPYLIRKYSISYTQSLTLLASQQTTERDGNDLLALGFGTANSARNDKSFKSLAGTNAEIVAIKNAAGSYNSEFYSDADATEGFFKQKVSQFDIVHLGIHGVGDTLDAMRSRLIFQNSADSIEDGSLYAHELYDLNLGSVDLAVLSACESGVGKMQTGEGAMSIARGFAYAGCPSIVMSLWAVDDNTSAKLMSKYYRFLSDEMDLDESLRFAKLEFLKEADELSSHPFYWAPLIHIGDTRPIEKNYGAMSKIFLLVGLAILLGCIAFAIKRKKWDST